MGYFNDHKEHFSAENERAKADQIMAVIADAVYDSDLERMHCLHTGCTEGTITHALSSKLASITGLDIDPGSIDFAQQHYGEDKCSFVLGDTIALPFPKETFELVVCNHIYNYVSDSRKMMEEIHRVLKPDGICYFAATQFGRDRAEYLTRNLSYKKLRKLVADFATVDYTIAVLRHPETFRMRLDTKQAAIAKHFHFFVKPLISIIPSYIWILKKKKHIRKKYTYR